MINDTIAIVATANMQSSISIIRISGHEAFEIINKLFTKNLLDKPSHTIHYGHIKDPYTNEIIDEVLVSLFHSPKSFTTENIVEINCHGGIVVTNKVLELVLTYGARLAHAGEFLKRAFIHGRLDLTKAEATNDIITAQSTNALKLATNQLSGNVKILIEDLKSDLLDIIAHIEVNIDYPEYDEVEQLNAQTLIPLTNQFNEKIELILANSRTGKLLKEGIDCAIIGKPNVGKSSLLNSLLQEQRAIVTSIAGTTRDTIEEKVIIDGIVLNLIDTAGIRASDNEVENIGIEKSKEKLEAASLVLLVLDCSQPLDKIDYDLIKITKHKNRLIILNKNDLGNVIDLDGIPISALNNDITKLTTSIKEMFNLNLTLHANDVYINNARQISLLEKAKISIEVSIQAMYDKMPTDLIAIDLEQAWTYLKEILGENVNDSLLDEIFSKFCLGK